MAAKDSAFLARTSHQPLRHHPAGGALVVNLSGGIVAVPVHQTAFVAGDVVDLSGFAAGSYSGLKTLTSASTARQIAFAATFAAEKLTGKEYITDGDLASGHLFSGGFQDPGVGTYPASTLPDEIGALDGALTDTTWSGGVSPTTTRGMTYMHATQALEGQSDVGTMGACPGVHTGIPGANLDLSGPTWPDFPIAHVTTRNNPAVTAEEIILGIVGSDGISFFITSAGVVTFGRHLVDPFLEVADHQIKYSFNIAGSKEWNASQSDDPPRILEIQFGMVSFTEATAVLVIPGEPTTPGAGQVLEQGAWSRQFRTVKIAVPGAALAFPLSTADVEATARQTGFWATEAGARAKGRNEVEIIKFRRLAVSPDIGDRWLRSHPRTGKLLRPFDIVELTHPRAQHLETAGVVQALVRSVEPDYGRRTVRVKLEMIRMGTGAP